MRKIEVKPLSLDAFRYYGTYHDLVDMAPLRQGEERDSEFYPDLAKLNLSRDMLVAASVARVAPCEPIIRFVELHKFTGEGILPIDGDIVIYVGKPGRTISTDTVEAFFVPCGTFVALNPAIVHGRQFVTGDAPVHVLILLPERTYANDCEFAVMQEDKQVLVDIK